MRIRPLMPSDPLPHVERVRDAWEEGHCLIWVAEDTERLVAWCVVHLHFHSSVDWAVDEDTVAFQSGENAYLELLEVVPERRGEGIGRQLLVAALQALAAQPKRWLWLHTGEANRGARRFYEREGWQWVKTVTPVWSPSTPMRVYRKEVYSTV